MNKEFQEEKTKGTQGLIEADALDVHFMQLDCASLKSTETFINTFKERNNKLHLLLLNAGIALHEQGKIFKTLKTYSKKETVLFLLYLSKSMNLIFMSLSYW